MNQSDTYIKEMPKGIPRTKYYTPDGREEWKIPQHRQRSDGVVYDVFLAEGYTLAPPENPKLYCAGCDRWHDTQEEVNECVEKKDTLASRMEKLAREELAKTQGEKDKRIADLETKIDKLTKLLEAKLGQTI